MKGLSVIGGIFMLILSVSSCSFTPDEVPFAGRPAEFPDMRLINTQYLLGIVGAEPITIQAETIEIYKQANLIYIDDASFFQNDTDNKELFTGSFGSAQVATSTNTITMEGGVTIRNHTDNFTIEAESLIWDHDNREAYAKDETVVTITLKDHDILKGTGFRGNFKTVTFEFSQVEEGQLHYE